MKIRKFEKEDILQVLELCREVRNHHREFLGGYFAEQDDEMEKVGFMQSLESNKIIALVAEEENSYHYLLLFSINSYNLPTYTSPSMKLVSRGYVSGFLFVSPFGQSSFSYFYASEHYLS